MFKQLIYSSAHYSSLVLDAGVTNELILKSMAHYSSLAPDTQHEEGVMYYN